MKVRIVVGEVELRTDGLEISKRQLVQLMREAGSIALAVAASVPTTFEDTTDGKPIGFTAQLELDPERNVGEDFSEWFEDE